MCSVSDDIEDVNSASCSSEFSQEPIPNSQLLKVCRKCRAVSVVLLQKKDPFCKDCFMAYCSHKFKSTIGKSKMIKHGDQVLIAYSGGICSSAMLAMVKEALAGHAYKKLMFVPGILYIDERFITCQDNDETLPLHNDITSALEKTNYPVLYSSLEQVCRENDSAVFFWKSLSDHRACISPTLRNKLILNLQSISSLTSRHNYVECLRMQLIKDIARHSGYPCIFLGDSATNLAIKLFSDVAVGRGSQISPNTAFCDSRSDVVIYRPMREFLNKELLFYNHLNNVRYVVLPTLLTMTDANLSIQRTTEKFVCGLQENFPATIFSIYRISSKITNSSQSSDVKCILCESQRDNVNPDLCSALEALKLSVELSKPLSPTESSDEASETSHILKEQLCHGCSIIIDHMKDQSDIPPFLLRQSQIYSRDRMREEIQEFILQPE